MPIVLGGVASVVVLTVLATVLPTGAAALVPSGTISAAGTNPIPGTDFTTYLGAVDRDSSSPGERLINVTDAASLQPLWNYTAKGYVAAQAVSVNGSVYVGAWDGYEYAFNATRGTLLWKTFTGQDNSDPGCHNGAGVTSTATVVRNTLYFLGGNDAFYAVNARTGVVQWSLQTGNESAGAYGWASPLIFNGFAYIGVASRCDTPLVTGGLLKVSLSSHLVVGFLNTTGIGTLGASIWSSPSLNRSSNTIYVTTGNPGTAIYGDAIVAINATTLAVKAHWKVPVSERIGDGDFGSTPILFTPKGGSPMVVATNKNGITYAWYQSNLTLMWEKRVSNLSTVITAGWGSQRLYVVASKTVIGGVTYNASIRALNPLTGATLWQDGLPLTTQYDYSAPLVFQGVVVFGDNSYLYVVNALTGAVLYRYQSLGVIQPPASVSHGILYFGSTSRVFSALDLRLTATAGASALSYASPATIAFTASVSGGLPPYSYNWSFGDGGYSASPNPSYVYVTPGNYTAVLTVTDQAGTQALSNQSIAIT